jgi:preprotein translocase subunit SecA
MDRIGMEEDEPIEHPLITKAIENAQTKVESHNFDIRKHLLEYDDVMNRQREVIYERRDHALRDEDLRKDIVAVVEGLVDAIVEANIEDDLPSHEWDLRPVRDAVFKQFSLPLNVAAQELNGFGKEQMREKILSAAMDAYVRKEQEFGEDVMRHLEKAVYLQVVDNLWKEHLLSMDHLREGIGLRGYGQRNPLQEYQKEGYEMFMQLMERLDEEAIEKLYMVQIAKEPAPVPVQDQAQSQRFILSRGSGEAPKRQTVRREGKKVGRNEPCPCGSGKKYKRCCGA